MSGKRNAYAGTGRSTNPPACPIEGRLFQFDLDDLAFGTPCVCKAVGDFGVHPMEFAGLDLVRGGLAVGRSHFQGESFCRDDEIWPHMAVHRRHGSGDEDPVVNARAWIFTSNGSSHRRRRGSRPLEKFDVQDIKRRRTYIVDPVCERASGKGVDRNSTGCGGGRLSFRFVPCLLRDRSTGKINGHSVVGVSVIERAFTGWQRQVENDNRFILQHDMMKWLVLNEHRR